MQFNNIWNKTKEHTLTAIRKADNLITRVENWIDAPIKDKLIEEMQITCRCTRKVPIDAVYCPHCGKQLRTVD